MEEERYPIVGEKNENGTTVSEPAVAYAAREKRLSGMAHVDGEGEKADYIPLGMFGFYTDAPEEFEQRVAEMEADMDEIDAGIEDPEKWIQVDDFWAAMRKEHPWL